MSDCTMLDDECDGAAHVFTTPSSASLDEGTLMLTLDGMAETIADIHAKITQAEQTIQSIVDNVLPLVDKLSHHPMVKMLAGGK